MDHQIPENATPHENGGTVNESNGAGGEESPTNREQFARRNFMTQVTAGIVGGVVGVVPFIIGLLFFFDPLLRKQSGKAERRPGGPIKDENGFIKLDITADALPGDGSPQLFKVHDDVVDAWNTFLNVEIGNVWLRRKEDGQVVAFSSICPHYGCAVDFRKANGDFYCPCHRSMFDRDGERLNQIPPRSLDTLELKPNTGNEIWIKYERFRANRTEKTPIV